MRPIHAAAGSSHGEPRRQHLEAAGVGLMAELDAEHVERHRVAVGPIGELEAGVRVDEAADQPRRRHPVDARPGPRHPAAAREVLAIARARRAPRGGRCARGLRDLLHDHLLQFGGARRTEVGDGVHAAPLVDEGADGAVGRALSRCPPGQALQQPPPARRQRPHVLRPRLAEAGHDVLVRPAGSGASASSTVAWPPRPAISAASHSRSSRGCGWLGSTYADWADLHRADLLEPAPHPDAHARRATRHRVEQDQPGQGRGGGRISHATLVALLSTSDSRVKGGAHPGARSVPGGGGCGPAEAQRAGRPGPRDGCPRDALAAGGGSGGEAARRRCARIARRDDREYRAVFEGGATMRGAMQRRPNAGTTFTTGC